MNISDKLEHIEEIIQSKLFSCDKETDKLKVKIDYISDQVERTIRKFEKEKHKKTDLSLQLKRMEDKKFDDKVVDGLVIMVKRQAHHMEEQLDARLEKKLWDKEFPKLSEKVQVVSETLDVKADREEVKKAFQFVEDKIKEIVLLMATDIQNEKEGAGKKLPFKCLSCDK